MLPVLELLELLNENSALFWIITVENLELHLCHALEVCHLFFVLKCCLFLNGSEFHRNALQLSEPGSHVSPHNQLIR